MVRRGAWICQTLCDWMHRFNAAGPECLHDYGSSDLPPRLSCEQQTELAAIIEKELNPVGNLWQCMRQNWLLSRVFDGYDNINKVACKIWQKLIAVPETITAIGMCVRGFISVKRPPDSW